MSSRYNEDKYEEEITETDDIYSEDKLISIEPSKISSDDIYSEDKLISIEPSKTK